MCSDASAALWRIKTRGMAMVPRRDTLADVCNKGLGGELMTNDQLFVVNTAQGDQRVQKFLEPRDQVPGRLLERGYFRPLTPVADTFGSLRGLCVPGAVYKGSFYEENCSKCVNVFLIGFNC